MNYIVCAKNLHFFFHITPHFLASCFQNDKYFLKRASFSINIFLSPFLKKLCSLSRLPLHYKTISFGQPGLRSQQLQEQILPIMVQGNKRVDPPSPAKSSTSCGSFFLPSPARSAGRLQRPKKLQVSIYI